MGETAPQRKTWSLNIEIAWDFGSGAMAIDSVGTLAGNGKIPSTPIDFRSLVIFEKMKNNSGYKKIMNDRLEWIGIKSQSPYFPYILASSAKLRLYFRNVWTSSEPKTIRTPFTMALAFM